MNVYKRDRKRGRVEGKLSGDYLKLTPELCLEENGIIEGSGQNETR